MLRLLAVTAALTAIPLLPGCKRPAATAPLTKMEQQVPAEAVETPVIEADEKETIPEEPVIEETPATRPVTTPVADAPSQKVATRVAQPGLETFYERLAPMGEWIPTDTYGQVWQPAIATADGEWQPYTLGQWVGSESGWTWVSDEPFGWAVYHYGRWVILENIGWVWIPGEEWGPAWVAWREGEDVVGWAPLPPEIEVWDETTIAEIHYDIGMDTFCYVPLASFAVASIHPRLIRKTQRPTLYRKTRKVARIAHHHRKAIQAAHRNTVRITQPAKRKTVGERRTAKPVTVRPSVEKKGTRKPAQAAHAAALTAKPSSPARQTAPKGKKPTTREGADRARETARKQQAMKQAAEATRQQRAAEIQRAKTLKIQQEKRAAIAAQSRANADAEAARQRNENARKAADAQQAAITRQKARERAEAQSRAKAKASAEQARKRAAEATRQQRAAENQRAKTLKIQQEQRAAIAAQSRATADAKAARQRNENARKAAASRDAAIARQKARDQAEAQSRAKAKASAEARAKQQAKARQQATAAKQKQQQQAAAHAARQKLIQQRQQQRTRP